MDKPLHILQVNKVYFPHIGGIESVVRTFSKELKKYPNVEVQVLVCQEKGKGTEKTVDGVQVHYASSLGTYFSCPLSLDFFLKFRRLSHWADVIEFHMPFPLGDLACLLSRYKGGVVLAWHSDVVRQKTLLRFYGPILKRFLKRADTIIAATKGHIDSSYFLSKKEIREKCRIIPYGLNTKAYDSVPKKPILQQLQMSPNSVRVLFVGRFVYYKGIEVLLEAFCSVKGCELFLVGHGTAEIEEKLHQMVAEAHQEKLIHFMGNLSDEQLRQAFADCDMFVLPSVANSEAFGIVQMEAMVYGKPVINTNLPTGVPYVSIHKKTGLTVSVGDASALGNAIQTLADDATRRKTYGDAGRRRVMQEFEESKVVRQVYETLETAAQKHRSTGEESV